MAHKIVKEWTTKAGLKAAIILTHGTHHCGYVEAPIALKNRDYNSIDEHIDVHGGITFSGELTMLPDMGWMFGYDCNHWNDRQLCTPEMEAAGLSGLSMYQHGVWRDEAYCTEECESMASQLISLNINKLIGKV